MMDYPFLSHKSIFAIPVEASSKGEKKGDYLIYAPLTDNVLIATAHYLKELEMAAEKHEGSKETLSLLDKLENRELYGKRFYKIKSPDDYLLLYILPNYTCNFSCSYCFSAKGRSNKEMSKSHLTAALDYFIDAKRIREKKLFITFLGGGEPMISWKMVKYGIEYAHERAKAQGIALMLEIVTNGSILSEEIVKTLVRYQVGVRISFEVLEDVQHIQRGRYDKVCQTIQSLTEANLYLEVRAMITPLNVERMEEMVAVLIERFPGIGYYMFDPITDRSTFNDTESTRSFYEKYRFHFFNALDFAEKNGKQLKCAPLRNLGSLVERYCFGELCLTPEGSITICHRIASPSDRDYQRCVYGRINESNQLEFDHDKYRRLISSDTVYDNPSCSTCFVKWNCGGGCMVQNREYSDEIRDVVCEFTRLFSKELLIRRAKSQQLTV